MASRCWLTITLFCNGWTTSWNWRLTNTGPQLSLRTDVPSSLEKCSNGHHELGKKRGHFHQDLWKITPWNLIKKLKTFLGYFQPQILMAVSPWVSLMFSGRLVIEIYADWLKPWWLYWKHRWPFSPGSPHGGKWICVQPSRASLTHGTKRATGHFNRVQSPVC